MRRANPGAAPAPRAGSAGKGSPKQAQDKEPQTKDGDNNPKNAPTGSASTVEIKLMERVPMEDAPPQPQVDTFVWACPCCNVANRIKAK